MNYLRRFIATSLFLLIVHFSFGQNQESKPTFQVGISGLPIVHLSHPQNGLALYGNFGIYLKEKIVLGLRPFYGHLKQKDESSPWIYSAGVNIYSRLYTNTGKWSFFLDLHAGMGSIWEEMDFENNFIRRPLWNYAFGPGLDIQLSKNRIWNLELLVQYLSMNDLSNSSSFSRGQAIIPTIGIQVLIP